MDMPMFWHDENLDSATHTTVELPNDDLRVVIRRDAEGVTLALYDSEFTEHSLTLPWEDLKTMETSDA